MSEDCQVCGQPLYDEEVVALRARVAKLEAALLVDGAKLLARNAKLEAALENVAKECSTFPIRDGLAFRCESITRAALSQTPDAEKGEKP